MKAFIACILLAGSAAITVAADNSGRPDVRVLGGVKNNVQDELDRRNKPFFIDGWLYQNVTNKADGIIIARSNATVTVHVVLPNPTNNYPRTFHVTTAGANVVTLSNAVVGTFTDMFTLTNGTVYPVASNKTATAYSTGTNWIVRLH